MTARTMTREEESLFYFQIVAAEVQAGLRCCNCLQRACSLEYGPFECRGEKPNALRAVSVVEVRAG